jgi:hypothetical protein
MPSTSKSQQRLFGWALACKRGESDRCPVNVKKLADSMSEEELEKFASTSHEGLPTKVKESLMDCVEMMETEDFDYFEETILEAEKISDVPPISKDIKTPPPADKVFPPPPGYLKSENGTVYTPSLFKLPGSNKKKDERRIMNFDEFLKRINYRTHDGIIQDGHGANRRGSRPALPSNIP